MMNIEFYVVSFVHKVVLSLPVIIMHDK